MSAPVREPLYKNVLACVAFGVSLYASVECARYFYAQRKLLNGGSHSAAAARAEAELKARQEKRKQAKGASDASHVAGRGEQAAVSKALESRILEDVVFPSDMTETFADVAGRRELKQSLYESIVLPHTKPDIWMQLRSSNQLIKIPTGILFYGPPGTGKTQMAKALAAATGATFINVRPSTMESKWWGESQSLVRAVFSVAHRFAPSIIFLDEADAFMRRRQDRDHEVTSQMRAEWLALQDGLLSGGAAHDSDPHSAVTVIACTNRPFDLDEAFLRRLPRSFFFDLPAERERADILRLMLARQTLDPDVDLDALAAQTAGYSGADLKELLGVAAAQAMRGVLKQLDKGDFDAVMRGEHADAGAAEASSASASAAANSSAPAPVLSRPLRRKHFVVALREVRPAANAALIAQLHAFEKSHRGGSAQAAALAARAAAEEASDDSDAEGGRGDRRDEEDDAIYE